LARENVVDNAGFATGAGAGGQSPLPPEIVARLQLGRRVAAEMRPTLPDHRAFVHIHPIIDSELGHMEISDCGVEPILVSHGAENPVIGFRLHQREIHRRFEEFPDDWDLVGLSIDEVQIVKNETEIAAHLAKWGVEINALTLPHNVNDPF
jgi:hypothetical protein